MGHVYMEANEVRFKNATYKDVQTALTAALNGGGGLDDRVEALETTVGDSEAGLVKDVNDLETAITNVYPDVYSTTPVKIGKWGADDLYRVVISIAALPNASTGNYDTNLSDIIVKRIYGTATSESVILPLPHAHPAQAIDCISLAYINEGSKIRIAAGVDRSSYSAEVVIEYIEAPSNNNNR